MKLLKLSTTDSNASFVSNFDEDIIIKKNSQIGVNNCVFEPKAVVYEVNGNTSKIEAFANTSDNVAAKYYTQQMETGTYSGGDRIFKLLLNLTKALNRTSTLKHSFDNRPNAATDDDFSVFSEWQAYIDTDDKVEIEMRYTPMVNPMNKNYANGFYNVRPVAPFDSFTLEDDNNTLSLAASQAPRTDEAHRICSPHNVGLSHGSGCFYAQIHSSSVGGLAPATNGFGMGISFHTLLIGDIEKSNATNPRSSNRGTAATSIPDTARNIEIDFRDQNSNYRVRSSNLGVASTFTDTGVAPSTFAAGTPNDNDVIQFKIDTNDFGQKVIIGSIIRTGSPNKTDVVTHILSETEQNAFASKGQTHNTSREQDTPVTFVPYIYFRGNGNTIKVRNLRWTLSPFIAPANLGGGNIIGNKNDYDQPVLPIGDDSGRENIGNAFIGIHMPRPDPNRFNEAFDSQNARLVLESTLASILGFKQNSRQRFDETIRLGLIGNKEKYNDLEEPDIPGDGDCAIIGANWNFENEPLDTFNDFYMIEAQSLLLDSYDSQAVEKTNNSIGNRKNILDTIPIVDKGIGVIAYEPNEVNFINIKNSENVNLRNLRMRIVKHDFSEVEIHGNAHITLLIKEPLD